MRKIMENTKGAISIFLVIVLVPMLTVASVFVDMSRINLAKSVAASAGDLTLNTALTNYDSVLKEMYGLFATSQDMDELFEKLENYYSQCIESAGIPDVEAENYVDQIMSLIKSESGRDDLMNMNLTSFEVEMPTGSNLANPAVLKSQIVEFMKYRAPINLGVGLFDALDSMKNLKKQSELVENKNEFYTEYSSMMEALEAAWNDIEDYQFSYGKLEYEGDTYTFPSGDFLKIVSDDLQADAEGLKTAISNTVRYIYFASDIKASEYSVIYSKGTDEASIFDDKWTIILDSETTYTPSKKNDENKEVTFDDVLEALQSAYSSIKILESYTKHNNEKATLYQSIMNSQNYSVSRKIQLVAEYNSKLKSDYPKAVKNMISGLVLLQGYYETYVSNTNNEIKLNEVYLKINDDNTIKITQEKSGPVMDKFCKDQLAHLVEEGNDYIPMFNVLSSRIVEYSTMATEVITQAKKQVNAAVDKAYTDIYLFNGFLTGRIDCLSKAIQSLNSIKSDLENPNSKYNLRLAEWKRSANGLSEDTMGIADNNEIARLEKILTPEKVEKLITRMEAAKASLESVKNSLGQFTILGQKWIDFGDKNSYSLKSLLKGDYKTRIDSVTPGTRSETETIYGDKSISTTYDPAYNDVINYLKGTVIHPSINLEWGAESSPDLQKQPQIELFTYLYNNFEVSDFGTQVYGNEHTEESSSSKISDEKNKADDSQSKLETSFDKEDEPAKGTDVSRDLTKDILALLPSGEWKKEKGEIKEAVKANSEINEKSDDQLKSSNESLGILDDLLDAVGTKTSDLRDNMYVANYIMNMFSYSTFEAEITKKYGEGKELPAFSSWYTEEKDEATGNYTYKLKPEYNIPELMDNAQTLTRVSINPNANYLYGEEIEYIIYGGTNAAASSYGTIYMIRFALNTVYAFTDAEIGSITTSAATALFGTPPLTPLVPVAKIAFTIALALAESAYDLYYLKSGEEIPLMKNENTWQMKPSSAAKAIAGEIASAAVDYALDEGYKVLNDALEKTDEDLEALIDSKSGDFDKFLNEVTDSTLNVVYDYANSAVNELVDICNSINLQEMEKSENYVKGQSEEKIDMAVAALDRWLASQGSSTDDVVYMVKAEAVSYIKSQRALIGELFDIIANPENLAAEAVGDLIDKKLLGFRSDINAKINRLTGVVGDKIKELKDNAKKEIEKAAKEGVESLRETLKNKISSTFGTSSATETSTQSVVNSLTSWAYSDYLQLFLIIGMLASPEAILLRTADVIELNMQTVQGNFGWLEETKTTEVSRLWGLIKYTKTETSTVANPKAYKLKNSYTHLKIKATIEVKPLLMTLPLMADTVESQLTGTNWYQIEYEGILGY